MTALYEPEMPEHFFLNSNCLGNLGSFICFVLGDRILQLWGYIYMAICSSIWWTAKNSKVFTYTYVCLASTEGMHFHTCSRIKRKESMALLIQNKVCLIQIYTSNKGLLTLGKIVYFYWSALVINIVYDRIIYRYIEVYIKSACVHTFIPCCAGHRATQSMCPTVDYHANREHTIL